MSPASARRNIPQEAEMQEMQVKIENLQQEMKNMAGQVDKFELA